MLVREDRAAETVMEGIERLTSPSEAPALARALQDEEWHAHLDDLLDRHRRKYKLVPMLKTLP